jgi:colanic acid biosynthesis protein WcaH
MKNQKKEKYIPEKLYKKIMEYLPIPCVDIVVKTGNRFLLTKRTQVPLKGQWWLPGGKIFFNENLTDALKRKLAEELNLKKFQQIKFLGPGEIKFKKGHFGIPEHDITLVYLVILGKKHAENIKLDKTASEYKWFNKVQNNFHPYLKKFLKMAKFK